jgi:hypothetical protein
VYGIEGRVVKFVADVLKSATGEMEFNVQYGSTDKMK